MLLAILAWKLPTSMSILLSHCSGQRLLLDEGRGRERREDGAQGLPGPVQEKGLPLEPRLGAATAGGVRARAVGRAGAAQPLQPAPPPLQRGERRRGGELHDQWESGWRIDRQPEVMPMEWKGLFLLQLCT